MDLAFLPIDVLMNGVQMNGVNRQLLNYNTIRTGFHM